MLLFNRVKRIFTALLLIFLSFPAPAFALAGNKAVEFGTGETVEIRQSAQAEYAPNEVIVKYKQGKSPEQLQIKANERAELGFFARTVDNLKLAAKGESAPEEELKELENTEAELAISSKKPVIENTELAKSANKSTPELAQTYGALDFVEYAEPNYYYNILLYPNDPYYSFQWHFPPIQTQEAWDKSQGANVIVAVIDTGVAYENYGIYKKAPDLAGTAFVSPKNIITGSTHANDDNSHGTHVAGTIAQTTNNNLGVAGVAFRAKIMPIKVLDSNGNGTSSNAAQGINWARTNGAKVINLSFGGGPHSITMKNAINQAYNSGIVIIAAAGNDSSSSGCNPLDYPAAYDNVISVGAVRYDETRSPYSDCGSNLDIVAPGGDMSVDQNNDTYADGVLQQTFNPNTQNPSDFNYYFLQGTSMAAPHVSGTAALLVAYGTASNPDQIKTALTQTAKDLGQAGKDNYYGYGLVQADSALLWQAQEPRPTNTPIPTNTPAPSPTSTPQYCGSDIDCSGNTQLNDIFLWKNKWIADKPEFADIDKNDKINTLDYLSVFLALLAD